MAAFDLGPNANPDFTANTGAENALSFGRTLQANHALQGIDFNSPATLDTAISGLTRAGATDQATALMKLTTARMVREAIPSLMQQLSGAAPAPSNQAPAPQPAAPAPDHQGMADHATGTMDAAKAALTTLQNTPEDQRPQAFASMKGQLLQRGVPEPIIDEAGHDLSDAGLAKWDSFLNQGGEHPTGYAATKAYVQQGDPLVQNAYGMLRGPLANPILSGLLKGYADIDTGPAMERAERLVTPDINAAAEAAHAGDKKLNENVADLQTMPTKLGNEAAGAGAKAGAEARAEAPYKDVTMKVDGAEIHGTMHVMDGKTVFVPTTEGGTGKALKGLTPGQEDFQQGQAKAVNDIINKDQAARTQAMTDRDNALKQLTIASTMKFDPATPNLAAAANMFRALPAPVQAAAAAAVGTTPDKIDKYAGTAALYNQGSKALIGQFMKSNGPPRYTQQELKFFAPVIGQLNDPNDAAKFMDALQVATANKTIARADYANDPHTVDAVKSNPSSQVYESGWAASAAGRAAILEDPVWEKTIIGGKPAVQRFTSNGKPYLAVLPGLGKPTYIPVR